MENKNSNFNLFLVLLGITFIILKLTLVIDWNWFLILLPLIYRFLGGWIALLIILVWALIASIFDYKKVSKINEKLEEKQKNYPKSKFHQALIDHQNKKNNKK